MSQKLSPPAKRVQSKIMHAVKRGDMEAAEQARREFKAIKAEDYIKTLVDSAPLLTPDVRDRLALLLRGSAA
jgi:radical SAM superfamily enzyme